MLDLGFSGSIVSATYDTVLNFRHRLCRMRTQSPLLTLPSFSRTSFYLQKLPDDSVSNSDNWTCLKGLFFSEGYSFSLTVPSMVLKLLSLGSPRPAPHKPWASSLAGVPFPRYRPPHFVEQLRFCGHALAFLPIVHSPTQLAFCNTLLSQKLAMLHRKMESHFLSLGFPAVCGITQFIPSGTVHLVQSLFCP